MKTLKEQNISIITQARTILSAKYGYVIQAGYCPNHTELEHGDKTHIILLVSDKEGAISFSVGVLKSLPKSSKLKKEVTKLVYDVLDIVNILN